MHPRTKIVSASDESVLFDAFAARQNSAVGWVFDQHATTTRREPGAWMGTTRPEALHSNSKTVFAGKAAKLRWITGGLSKTLLVVENAGSPDQILGNKRTENLNSLSWISGTLGFHENLFIRFDPFPWEGASALEGPVNFANGYQIYSFHPGGAHVSMCDGSVRFLGEQTSREVAFALATRTNATFNSR